MGDERTGSCGQRAPLTGSLFVLASRDTPLSGAAGHVPIWGGRTITMHRTLILTVVVFLAACFAEPRLKADTEANFNTSLAEVIKCPNLNRNS
jgi:hypothetical protein